MFTANIPASQIRVGDVINGKKVIFVARDNKTKINIKVEGERRGSLVHHNKRFTISTTRTLAGTGFA